jgi:pentose-5-phosphate-3-epimerase
MSVGPDLKKKSFLDECMENILAFLRDFPGSTHIEIEMELGIDYVTFKKARLALGERIYSTGVSRSAEPHRFYINEKVRS